MTENNSNSNDQPSIEEQLSQINNTLRIDLTRNKPAVAPRELNEFIKKITHPPFASTHIR